MKVTICFRNGEKINIKCEEIKTRTLNTTNELMGYSIDGVKGGDKPLWLDVGEVLYIIRKEGEE